MRGLGGSSGKLFGRIDPLDEYAGFASQLHRIPQMEIIGSILGRVWRTTAAKSRCG